MLKVTKSFLLMPLFDLSMQAETALTKSQTFTIINLFEKELVLISIHCLAMRKTERAE